jgi:AcrR family transcriptional regulator
MSQEERIAQRRGQLIEAGLQTFGTRGFHSVSVRDICGEAKLTERYFYESFTNREGLFLAVYTIGIDRVRENVTTAMASAKPEEVARAGLRAYLETLREEPRLARILLVESLRIGLEVSSHSLLATSSFADMLSGIISELYPDLRARKLDVQWISHGLVGATVFMAMQWALREFDEPLETVLDHCVVFYESLALQAGPPAPSPAR